ncbi:MAG: DinB family protein [Pyrinomonadaceae bacterium]
MFKEALIEIFERDLNKLKDEINLYSDENKLWVVKEEISNSAGNLCQHLLGNLNHFIGALLGNSGYERDRDSEFSSKNATRAELTANIEKTLDVVKNSLNQLSNEDFEKDFPVAKHEKIVRTDFMLLHLLTHFNYHLGQINYHRRLIS